MSADLAALLYRIDASCRPFTGVKPPVEGRRSAFSATLASTVRDLAVELRAVEADQIVIELDYREQDLRLDGFPRSNARPLSPAVGLAFTGSFGPQRYATGLYSRWDHNLRAITLGMEALRAVDRHGISRRGEQYVGYRALPASTDPADAITTSDQALAALADVLGGPVSSARADDAIRRALRKAHPDAGGNNIDFRRVMRAKEILEAVA